MQLTTEPALPTAVDGRVCTLFHEVLLIDYRNNETIICEGCNTIKEPQEEAK
jgi:hypothetical protein